MNSLRRFLRLHRFERLAFLQALVLLPLSVLALRWCSVQRWQSFLLRLPGGAEPREGDPAVAQQRARATARMVLAATRRLPLSLSCLHRSVTLWWLLRRQGLEAALRIGTRLQNSSLEAHAWVEWGGHVLNDAEDAPQRFAPFDRAIPQREGGSR